jgi:shikimate dehydrogenase
LGGLTRLGVLGWPVAHSRSPAMHNAALRAVGLHDWRYQLLPVPPELLAETVAALPGAGFVGANVTIPHKEAALRLATAATVTARGVGAANTLTFAGGEVRADNTDVPALLQALEDLRPRTAVVLGAGGSARAAVYALQEAGASVAVWNRTPERARALASDMRARAVGAPPPTEVLVNCTSVGLRDPSRTFKDLPLQADALSRYACVVDLVYRAGGTRLVKEARRRGSHVIDGLELLVLQGALSFQTWTGRAAPVEAMRRAAHADEPAPQPDEPRTHPPATGADRRGAGP